MKSFWIAVAILVLPLCNTYAQRESFIWYFGDRVGLDFNTRPPSVLPLSKMNSSEGCATYSDPKTGKLLFYTNGVEVWDKDHDRMPNGYNLKGHRSSTQSALILPWPDNHGKFFLFTTDNDGYEDPPNDGLNYSIVDLSLNEGKGDVIQKNTPLLSQASEKLTAIARCDELGYYIVAHSQLGDTFFVYDLLESGVSGPVISQAGQKFIYIDRIAYTAGYLKASPARNELAMMSTYLPELELFSFDFVTRKIWKKKGLGYGEWYGCSYSPSGKFLYISHPYELLQIDLLNDYSVKSLYQWNSDMERPFALALAPDSSIYVSLGYSQWLGRIARPDSLGDSSLFNPRFIKMQWNTIASLPNFVDSRYDWSECPPPVASIDPEVDTICAGESIVFQDRSTSFPVFVDFIDADTPRRIKAGEFSELGFEEPGLHAFRTVVSNSGGADTTTSHVYVKSLLRNDPEVVLQLERQEAYPGDTVVYKISSDALNDLPGDVYLSFSLVYDTSILKALDSTSLNGDRVVIRMNSPEEIQIRFVSKAGNADSTILAFADVHWINACPLPVKTINGSLRLKIKQEGEIRVQEGKSSTISPYPNPSVGLTKLMVDLAKEGKSDVWMVDAAGRKVLTLEQPLVLGKNWLDFDLTGLAAGSYTFILRTPYERVNASFVYLGQ